LLQLGGKPRASVVVGHEMSEGGTAIVLTYVFVSMGVIIAFLLAAFVIGWFIGRLRQRSSEQSGEE
jgi:biotin transporter BioY